MMSSSADSAPRPLAPTRTRQSHQATSRNPNWTQQEDDILHKIKTSSDNPKWSDIMQYFPMKTQHQVNERWEKVLNPDLIKGSWTREEDELIVSWVAEKGTKQWGALAAKLPGRLSKQCRERWHNHLSPSVKKSDWTEEEDAILIDCQSKWGNKWSKIAELLPGRTDNSVKNRWNSSLKRRLERLKKGQEPNAKRGRKPKRPSEPPSIEVISTIQASETTETSKELEVAVNAKIEIDDIPKPISFDSADAKSLLSTPERAMLSPIPMSPGFGSLWSPANLLVNVTPGWTAGMMSPLRATGDPLNGSDLMGIPGPKFDE